MSEMWRVVIGILEVIFQCYYYVYTSRRLFAWLVISSQLTSRLTIASRLANNLQILLMQSSCNISSHLVIDVRTPETLRIGVSMTARSHDTYQLTMMTAIPEKAIVVKKTVEYALAFASL